MKKYKPMLAKTAESPFSSRDWIFELKWDGIRALAYINDEISIKSRNQKELKNNFPELAELSKLAKNVVLDGEIVCMKDGKVNFENVIKRVQATSFDNIKRLQRKYPVLYILFDILEKNGNTLLDEPLLNRKKILKESVKEGKNVILSVFVEDNGEDYYQATIQKGLEGIMAKKKNSKYELGKRSVNWLKIKLIRECDCVIFGFTKGAGRRETTFGALILGMYNGRIPIFIGKVGTGFNQKTLKLLKQKLKILKVKQTELKGIDSSDNVIWVKPIIVCKIGYQTITSDEKLRLPRFLELRSDKDPKGSKNIIRNKIFVIQEHDASHLHYDLRLERNGVLNSWAVPKGIPLKPGIKRLAIKTEDHPLEYAEFQGIIPKGQYGGGTVKIWDKGNYKIKVWEENKIEFNFQGTKLTGVYVLIRFKKGGENNWLLMKVGNYNA
jgi:bifunctional non-homologous end joining protein LigD